MVPLRDGLTYAAGAPLSGLVLAFFLLDERPSAAVVLSAVLILAGVVVARRR